VLRRERTILNEQHKLILFRLHRQNGPKPGHGKRSNAGPTTTA
jgi:hypothetical protein